MRIKSNLSLWGAFVAVVIGALMLSSLVTTGLLMMAVRHGVIAFRMHDPLFPLISFVVSGTVVGTVVSLLIGSNVLRPLMALGRAIREIARGNFSVRLSENDGIEPVREMSRDFNTMAHELGGIETLRNDFVTNVSHEFKTPLASIEGYATLLQSCSSEEDKNEYTRLIIESTKKLSNLTSNILRLSKLENQEIVPSKEAFSLDEQLRQALLLLEPQWSAKNLELDIDLEPVTFYGSEELLMQVWLNLLSNAIKFAPNGSTVGARLAVLQNAAEITISDSGPGIAPEAQKHIFEKFYQADSARSSEGNGLGLALVSRIVSLCGGSVLVKSAVGEGAVFTVTLPNAFGHIAEKGEDIYETTGNHHKP